MNEINGIRSARAQKMVSQPKASIEGADYPMNTSGAKGAPDDLQSLEGGLELKMQEADDAFALMMEVHQRIEAAYEKLKRGGE